VVDECSASQSWGLEECAAVQDRISLDRTGGILSSIGGEGVSAVAGLLPPWHCLLLKKISLKLHVSNQYEGDGEFL
jgi:hypothetical protein